MLAGFAGVDRHVPKAGRRIDAEASVVSLRGVGPKVAEQLAHMGLRTIRDLVEHIPRDYLDWREADGFGQLLAGQEATVACTVERVSVRPTRRRNLKIVQASVVDA